MCDASPTSAPAEQPPAKKPKVTPDQAAIINKYARRGAAMGVPGSLAMHADLLPLTTMWGVMTYKLARQAGWKFNKENCLKAATAGSQTAMSVLVAIRLGGWLFKKTPPGFILTMFANSAANYACTYVVGQKAAKVFNTEDFDERTALEKIFTSLTWSAVHFDNGFDDLTGAMAQGKKAIHHGKDLIEAGWDFIHPHPVDPSSVWDLPDLLDRPTIIDTPPVTKPPPAIIDPTPGMQRFGPALVS